MADLVDALTEREHEILSCLIEGLSNAEIGSRLHITPQTVRWYNTQIYSKLGVKKRADAVATAIERGLLDVSPSIESIRHNLPNQTTHFIGREKELVELAHLLQDERLRLITILASGGMGKTRLALEISRQQMLNYPDGVFFVALAPINSPSHLVTNIADALGLHFHGDREPKHQLLEYLADKQLLLILDNFEHLLNAASFVNDILKTTTQLTVLVTSRERLGLTSEKIFSISGMVFPDWETPEDALEYDAVQLFMQCSRMVRTDFEPQADDLRYLARICRLTEGMPLAIMLSAAWVDVLSLEEIATEIQESVNFLATEMRDLPRRQWSIRAVFDPTWKRLNEDEQNVFMKFAVFRGGCTREAAQAVTGASLRQMQTFVNKALLTRTSDRRYEIHELLRQYAEEHLKASDQLEETYDNHSHYFCNFLAEHESDIKEGRQTQAKQEILADFENIRSAWNHAIDQRQNQLIDQSAEGLLWFCIIDGRYEESKELFQKPYRVFSSEQPNEFKFTWKRIQTRLFLLERWRVSNYSEPADTLLLMQQYLEFAQEINHKSEIGVALFLLADMVFLKKQNDIAMKLYENCLAHLNALNEKFYLSWAIQMMGVRQLGAGDYERAISTLEQSLEIKKEINDKYGLASVLYNLGDAQTRYTGNIEKAEDYFWASSQQSLTYRLGAESYIPLLKGDFERATEMATAREVGPDGIYATPHHVGRSLYLSAYGILTCINGDYDAARDYCLDGLAVAPRELYATYAEWGLALIACAQEDFDEAIRANHALLQYALNTNAPGQMTWGLPAGAMIAVHQGDTEKAVHLMSLAFNHPASTSGWLENWSLIQQFLDELKSELGAEAYETAWEHAKTLELKHVIEEWLAIYQ